MARLKLKKQWKTVSVLAGLFLLTLFSGCVLREPLRLPFSTSQVEKIEIYRYVVPSDAEKKTAAASGEIQEICDVFTSTRVSENTLEPVAGGQVTSFRFCLDDGSKFEMVYVSHDNRIGELRAEGFDCQTEADLGRVWDACGVGETVPVSASELPSIPSYS